MQMGTPGAAYGPGYAVSRPTLGAGTPLDGGRGTTTRRIPKRAPMLMPTKFDPGVHQNELVNRMAALRVAQHPTLTGVNPTLSPLMAAHQSIRLAPAPAAPAPLMALPDIAEAAIGNPTPRPPRGNPGLPPGPLKPVPGLGDFRRPKARADVADLLSRAMLARRGRMS